MIEIDRDGLLLCELQAKTFELSIDETESSSAIFVRRFMHSEVAKLLDNKSILDTNYQPADFLDMINRQYGTSNYGSSKYSYNEMYWMGYVYRYFAYTYDKSSSSVYRIIKPKELRDLYLPYHTLDPAQAIERILEAKGLPINLEMDISWQYEIFRRIRKQALNKKDSNLGCI